MAEIVNLRLARKAQKRARADGLAAANRVRFGQTKGETLSQRAEARRQARQLVGAKREED